MEKEMFENEELETNVEVFDEGAIDIVDEETLDEMSSATDSKVGGLAMAITAAVAVAVATAGIIVVAKKKKEDGEEVLSWRGKAAKRLIASERKHQEKLERKRQEKEWKNRTIMDMMTEDAMLMDEDEEEEEKE